MNKNVTMLSHAFCTIHLNTKHESFRTHTQRHIRGYLFHPIEMKETQLTERSHLNMHIN